MASALNGTPMIGEGVGRVLLRRGVSAEDSGLWGSRSMAVKFDPSDFAHGLRKDQKW